jgi:4a-hydroxytetrahydrobiopterin dehydratase
MILENKHILELVGPTGWLLKGDSIFHTYKFDQYSEAIDFINEVASLSMKYNIFPDLDLTGGRVKIFLTDAEEGGVSEKTISLASKIDALGY